jgi:hypothetical protein
MSVISDPTKGDPKARLIFLCILLALVWAAMYQQYQSNLPKKVSYSPGRQKMIASDDGATPDDPMPGVEASKTMTEDHIISVVNRDDRDERTAQDLKKIGFAVKEGFPWLKARSHEELAALAMSRGRWSYYKVMREPDRWRLQMVHVYGILADKRIEEFPDMPVGLRKLFRLTLYDVDEQVFYTVLTPQMPEAAKAMENLNESSYLACEGMFIMRFPYVSIIGWKRTPLFFAKCAYLAREPETPPLLLDERGDPGGTYEEIRPVRVVQRLNPDVISDDRMFVIPKNETGYSYTGPGGLRHEASNLREIAVPLMHTFEYVHKFSDEELKQAVNPALNYRALTGGNQADKWMRGQVTKFEGAVGGDVQTMRFPADPAQNPSQITRIHILTGIDLRLKGFDCSWGLATLNLPPDLREGDLIEAEGVFLKIYPYLTTERKWHWAPLIVCKNVRRIPREKPSLAAYLAVVAILGSAFILLYRASRRDSARMEQERKRIADKRVAIQKKRRDDVQGAKSDGEKSETTESEI